MTVGLSTTLFAGSEDDPLLYKVMIDKLEIRAADGPDPLVLDADAWVGKDLDKFWFKTEVELADGKTTEAEVQFLYSRAVAPFGISRLVGAGTSNLNPSGIIWHSASKAWRPISLKSTPACLSVNRGRSAPGWMPSMSTCSHRS